MNISKKLEDCCLLLESTKVNSRKEGCSDMIELLYHKSTVEYLNDNGNERWQRVLNAVQSCMLKDGHKKVEDSRKKAAPIVSVDVFVAFVRVATKECAPLDFKRLLSFIIESLKDSTKTCYHDSFLKLLSQSFLTNADIMSRLQSRDWETLYSTLKLLYEKKSGDTERLKCLALIVKWGPLYRFPVNAYREEFAFIENLCKKISTSSPKIVQEAVLEILFEFSKHIAKDNRMVCCKLGEDVFMKLMDLYQGNANNDKMKTNLVEFFLFQVAIHHPNGVKKEHPAAYAVSWNTWKNCLFSIYRALDNEIDVALEYTIKNQAFFLCKDGVRHLLDTFVFLFVEVCQQLFTTDYVDVGEDILDSEERPSKRPRLDVSLKYLIEKIRDSKSWTWISLVYNLIESYPTLINGENYVDFLKILTTFQSEIKDITVTYHVYKALIVLEKVESVINVNSYKAEIDQLWKNIADSALRSVGVNHNDEQIQILIQKLILKKIIATHENLFQNYLSGAVWNLTEHNLRTLDVAFVHFSYLQFDSSLKVEIMQWILNNNFKAFCQPLAAEILVHLTLKQWPNRLNEPLKKSKKPFKDIEDVYLNISFEDLLIGPEVSNGAVAVDAFCSDQSLLNTLFDLLQKLREKLNVKENIEALLYFTLLIFNIISYLVKYELIETGAINDLSLFELFEMCSRTLFANLNLNVEKPEGRNLEKVAEYVQILNSLFSTNISTFVSKKLRELIPQETIKSLFIALNTELEETIQEDTLLAFKKRVVEALTTFSCLPDSGDLLAIQERALECLVTTEYDCANDTDYELVMTLLHSLKLCKPKSLNQDTWLCVFNLFQNVCEVRYHHYLSAMRILELFYGIYPFVVDSATCRSQFVEILYPFYDKRTCYGPGVSVRLLDCMRLLFELEPVSERSRWKNEEIVLKMAEFLDSEHQSVRFSAIKNIATFFKISSRTRLLEQFHRQEIMFSKVVEMNLRVLEIEGEVSAERVIDETVTRTSSIYHTYASIMVASYLWIDEALFALLKLVCDKKIDLTLVKKVVDLVAKKLSFDNGLSFLERCVVSLFGRWKSYDVEQFPFELFNCENKVRFYSKYWSLLASIVVDIECDKVKEVAAGLGKSIEEVVEDVCPLLLSHCIIKDVSGSKKMNDNKTYQMLIRVLGVNKLKDVFQKKIDEIFLHLLELVHDEADFKKMFHENIIFPKHEIHLKVQEFQECIQFIENAIYKGNSLMSHQSRNSPEMIHHILLHLNRKVTGARALEEKLRYFYLYAISTTMCLEGAKDETSIRTYLVRDVTYSLLHFVKNHQKQPELSKISCSFFKMFLQKLVPAFAETLRQFLLTILSRLKNLALEKCGISDICVEMLHFLIVDHGKLFTKELEKLDSIPKTDKLKNIYSVHFDIKYNNRVITLEDEIKQFLEFTKDGESLNEHGLKHLKVLLSSKKDELKGLYEKLRQTRGFSEDCEKSCLHQLICTLITLCSSPNSNVSTEAVRCLGEIGPADLATLILQPEKPIPDRKWTFWELLLGCALSLLTKYIVDSDVEVVTAASTALFQILARKEGRKVAESESDFGFGVINCDYLTPFFSVSLRKNMFNVSVVGDRFMATMADDNLWIPQNGCHKSWITGLVCALLDSFQETEFFASFINVCKLKMEFCEQMLPLIIYTILNLNVTVISNLLSSKIESFFSKHWDITIKNKVDDSTNITVNKSSVQCMLNVVHFIRLQSSVKTKRQIKDLSLDYLKVAKAAHFCTAHFTALLYAELWCQEQISQAADDYSASTCNSTKLDLIYEKFDEVTGNALQNILRKAYKAVGEVDALLGCGTSYLLNDQCRNEHRKELGKWQQVIHHYEMKVSHGQHSSLQPLVQSLNSSNLYQLSLFCSNSLDEPNFESLWRLGHWNYNKPVKNNNLTYDNCDKFKFYAMKALHDDDEFNFKKSLSKVQSCIVHNLSGVNLESSKNFYNILTQLQAFKEVEDFFHSLTDDDGLAELLSKWKVQDDITRNDFQYVEPIMAQRMVLLTEYLKRSGHRSTLKDTIVDMILEFAQLARTEGNAYTASRTLESLRVLPSVSHDLVARIQFEEAQICWSLQDVTSAKCILKQLCTDENVNPRLHAMALKLTGKLMVENSSESRRTIIEEYFQKSLTLLKKNVQRTVEDEKSVVDTYDQLAKFADDEYQQVMAHIKSDIFQKKKQYMQKARQDVNRIKSTVPLNRALRDFQKAVTIKEKQSRIDQVEIENIESEKNSLLQFALKYYLLNLVRSDDHNITIFRVISLLLENRNNDVITAVLDKELIKIPTYKFVNILPQIVPHISSSAANDLFCQTVDRVVENCAKEHPYHTLPLILSLALANRDRSYAESKAAVNEARMQSAKNLLKKIKKDSKLAALIAKMENLSEALIEVAYYKGGDDEDASFRLPKRCKIRSIQGYDDVLLPTYTLPVDKSCNYSRIVGISCFGDNYNNVGGINAPKRITCRGTDGITRTQLVKGQDDLRQDAVMQQVFTIINSLLAVNKQTNNLLIRTYKIVPLSMRSGVLEWVENTIPIGEYLAGGEEGGGAHVKYRPMDRTPARCRIDFKNAGGKTPEVKLSVFNKICKNIKPVFHKFFETTFPQPTLWYERRRAYTHSVATSSMCGYILGIGDRHVSNILIDKSTAEVIHIDFGIAFEQGGVLPTPETVPFRLTRDIVDGMGVSGVEGVFRRSCEKTLEVLRLHYQTIITILEVLLYDPLYDWTVSSAEANKRQKDEQDESQVQNLSMCGGDDDTSKDVNVTAERALLRLRAKLQGTEHGKLTTVEHQVATLIQQAVDPSNLCRLFHGWQPYL